MIYAITITTKDPEIKIIHDLFKLKCEEFMKQHYKNREYKLYYEYGNHSTGWHAHGSIIDCPFLPKNNKHNLFYVYIKKVDNADIWYNYCKKEELDYGIIEES